MELQWHIRLIDRLISLNPAATIKDYLRLTDPYLGETPVEIHNIDDKILKNELLRKIERSQMAKDAAGNHAA